MDNLSNKNVQSQFESMRNSTEFLRFRRGFFNFFFFFKHKDTERWMCTVSSCVLNSDTIFNMSAHAISKCFEYSVVKPEFRKEIPEILESRDRMEELGDCLRAYVTFAIRRPEKGPKRGISARLPWRSMDVPAGESKRDKEARKHGFHIVPVEEEKELFEMLERNPVDVDVVEKGGVLSFRIIKFHLPKKELFAIEDYEWRNEYRPIISDLQFEPRNRGLFKARSFYNFGNDSIFGETLKPITLQQVLLRIQIPLMDEYKNDKEFQKNRRVVFYRPDYGAGRGYGWVKYKTYSCQKKELQFIQEVNSRAFSVSDPAGRKKKEVSPVSTPEKEVKIFRLEDDKVDFDEDNFVVDSDHEGEGESELQRESKDDDTTEENSEHETESEQDDSSSSEEETEEMEMEMESPEKKKESLSSVEKDPKKSLSGEKEMEVFEVVKKEEGSSDFESDSDTHTDESDVDTIHEGGSRNVKKDPREIKRMRDRKKRQETIEKLKKNKTECRWRSKLGYYNSNFEGKYFLFGVEHRELKVKYRLREKVLEKVKMEHLKKFIGRLFRSASVDDPSLYRDRKSSKHKELEYVNQKEYQKAYRLFESMSSVEEFLKEPIVRKYVKKNGNLNFEKVYQLFRSTERKKRRSGEEKKTICELFGRHQANAYRYYSIPAVGGCSGSPVMVLLQDKPERSFHRYIGIISFSLCHVGGTLKVMRDIDEEEYSGFEVESVSPLVLSGVSSCSFKYFRELYAQVVLPGLIKLLRGVCSWEGHHRYFEHKLDCLLKDPFVQKSLKKGVL